MSTPSSIGEKWKAFNTKVDGFVNTAETKIGEFSKNNPKIALALKVITGLALAAIALTLAPITTVIGFGVGATIGLIFPDHIKMIKEKVAEFYNGRGGLGKIGLLTAVALSPIVTPLAFGIVSGGLAGSTARDYMTFKPKSV